MNPLYRQFTGDTAQTDAQTYCDSLVTQMPLPSDGVTKAWCAASLLNDGSYIVTLPVWVTDSLAVSAPEGGWIYPTEM